MIKKRKNSSWAIFISVITDSKCPGNPVRPLSQRCFYKLVNVVTQKHVALGLNGDEINKERFPLPTLQDQLEECKNEVLHGSGVAVIRGLDPAQYSDEDNTMLFLGFSNYFFKERGLQSFKGAMLSRLPNYSYPALYTDVFQHI